MRDDVIQKEDGPWFVGRYEIPLPTKQRLDKAAKQVGLEDFTSFIDIGLMMGICYESCDPDDQLQVLRRNSSGELIEVWNL